MEQKKINYIKAKAGEGADKFPIEQILSRFNVEYRIRGTQAWFRCPVCNKPKFDYCSATVKGVGSGKWCCQSCKAGGGTFRLYGILSGKDDSEALLELGVLSGTITNEEFEMVTGTEDSRYKLRADEAVRRRIAEKEAEEVQERKAPVKTVDFVYRNLLSLPEFRLSKEGREYLRGRRLSDREIEEEGYFSYKEKFKVSNLMNIISKAIFKKNTEELDEASQAKLYRSLWGIPGFYFEFSDKEKKTGVWRFVPPCKSCVGIPIRNSEGQITALQMRWLEGNRDNKYFYVSSRKYHLGQNTSFGSSPGSPVSVIYPEKVTGETFYVTEGVFKARELAKSGNVCYSVQGVNSYYYVADEILETLESPVYKAKGGAGIKRIALAFDADMYGKWQVLDAAVKASANISRKTQKDVYVLLWNPELGKGFDDMKFTCDDRGVDYRQNLKSVDWHTFSDWAKAASGEADKWFAQQHGKMPEAGDRTGKEWGSYLYWYLFECRVKTLL